MQAPTGSTSRSTESTATLVRGPTAREGGFASRATATMRTDGEPYAVYAAQALEIAAWLHDVGLVGIRRSLIRRWHEVLNDFIEGRR